MPATVASLLQAGRLEVVPIDLATARTRLLRAQQHLETAAGLADQDNEVAYMSLYDAARKAASAHMLANGLRAPGKAGAHEVVGIYLREKVADASGATREFQRMRRYRNRSEYDDMWFGHG